MYHHHGEMDPDRGSVAHAKGLDVSIIIPVKDEAENVASLAAEVEASLSGHPWRWECLWVDDGSTDGTLSSLEQLCRATPVHRVISHETNFGQSAALATGFFHARGRIFVTLDGDGQNDPAGIPLLVQRLLDDDAHMVNGWRKTRMDSWIRKISSRLSNAFRNVMTGEEITDVGCALRAFRRQCVEGIFVFKGMHRFLPTLVRINGYSNIVEVAVNHRPRRHGETKYGIGNRLWVGLADTLAVRWMQWRAIRPQVRTGYGKKPIERGGVHRPDDANKTAESKSTQNGGVSE